MYDDRSVNNFLMPIISKIYMWNIIQNHVSHIHNNQHFDYIFIDMILKILTYS